MSYFPECEKPETLEQALVESIAKWRLIHGWFESGELPEGFGVGDIYGRRCPLCSFFRNETENVDCFHCPLFSDDSVASNEGDCCGEWKEIAYSNWETDGKANKGLATHAKSLLSKLETALKELKENQE
jgi:hypothetical protein